MFVFRQRIGRIGLLLIVFCLCAQATAETIPFDYWYGRIIGRTQIQSIHDAYNGETGILTTNIRVGRGDDVSVGLGDLTRISEASGSGAFYVKFYRPVLSANIAAGKRTRWVIDALDWQDEAEVSGGASEYWQLSSSGDSRFVTDQTIRMLHKDIEYVPERSQYMYTKGMLLQPGNWSLDARVRVQLRNSSSAAIRKVEVSDQPQDVSYRYERDEDWREWTVAPTLGYGVSQRLEVRSGFEISRGSHPYRSEAKRGTTDAPDVFSLEASTKRDASRRNYGLFVEPEFFISNSHWASLRAAINTAKATEETNDHSDVENAVARDRKSLSESTEDQYRLELNHSWISNEKPIARGQILDDEAWYYGRRLAPGTLRISSAAGLLLERQHQELKRESNVDPDESQSQRYKYDQFYFVTGATYYSNFNFDLSADFALFRRRNELRRNELANLYSQNELYTFAFGLKYYSYRWSPDKRQSIGWNQISDIDYLYGPLLQPRDWRASVSVYPPTHRWSDNSVDAGLFNFFKGESDNRWSSRMSAEAGVCEGIDADLEVYYTQEMTSYDYPNGNWTLRRNDRWDLAPRIRWQPGRGFRVDFTIMETYIDTDVRYHQAGENTDGHQDYHEWQMKVIYSIVI